MLFGPADPSEACCAPPFGTGRFWSSVVLRGAFWTCSFQWPDGLVLGAATPAVASPAAPDRSAFVAVPSGSVELSGWLPGGSPRASSDRPPTFFPSCLNPPIRQSGLLRVDVTAQTLLRIEPDTTTSFDFYLNRRRGLLGGDGDGMANPQTFSRTMQVAIFEQLCEEHGLRAPGPAPRGRFTPPIGSRAFFRAVAARGVG